MFLPISQHVSDAAEILGADDLLQLLLRQPLEIVESKQISLEVSLSCHNPALHEEDLVTDPLNSLGLRVDVWLDDMVANWRVADDPGVHVDTGGLDQDTFSSLKEGKDVSPAYIKKRNPLW